jgi:hypothetical protein
LKEKAKPLYQPWSEEAFWGDNNVRRMTQLQRWMYRTLLQAAFFGDLRPNLPDDDDELWLMADCADKDQWLQNSAPIRRMFTSKTLDDGVTKVLFRNRLDADWDRLIEKRQQLAENGRKGGEAKALANAKQLPSKCLANSGQVSKEVKKEREVSEAKEENPETEHEEVLGLGEEPDMMIESLLKERARGKFTGGPDTLSSEQRKALRAKYDEFGQDELLARFDVWAASAPESLRKPLAAFLGWRPTPEEIGAVGSNMAKSVVSAKELKACVLAIAKASGGDVVLGPRHQTSVAEALAEFGHDTVLLAFKDFWAGFGGEKKWAELDFSGKVGIYCELAVERKRKEAELAAQLSAARQAEIAKGEAEAARVDEEDELVEQSI